MSNYNKLPIPADKIVGEFVDNICNIEPAFVDGIYITGSVPMNDFYCDKSDIDFIVLCKNMPGEKILPLLRIIHKKIEKRYPKPNLSGSYIASDSIITDKPCSIKTLTFHEGEMGYGTLEMGPISLSELKYNAITILGQESETLPIEIKKEEINNFLHNNINSYWAKWIDQHSSFLKRKILLLFFPRLTEWSVLGVARQLCTLHTGKIVSKTEAGYCCLRHLPKKFHHVIMEAIEIRKDNRTYPLLGSYAINPSIKRLTQTIDCVKYMIESFNKKFNSGHQK